MKHIVGIAEMKVSSTPGDLLVTYALGSCLGIAIHDPVAKVGGLLHVMLPMSNVATGPQLNPCKFVDTGVPLLFTECYRAGAVKQRLVVKVAGGASAALGGQDSFEIGKRNFLMLRQLLWKNSVLIDAHDVGGSRSRTMALRVGTGEVALKIGGDKVLL